MKENIQLLLFFLLLVGNNAFAQVGINTNNSNPDASAMLDVQSTNKGMLIPRMTTTQRTTIASPATGLLVFDSTTASFWFYNGSTWEDLSASVSDKIVDADNDTKIQVEESADEDVIRFDTDGTQRMIINNNGFVGLGPGNPTANLTVIGTATTNTEIAHFSNSNNAKKAIVGLNNSGGGQMALLGGSNNTDILLSANANSYFNVANLGLGNNNPQEKLHITGNIRMEDGNQGLGKVMTSDADGKATWQTIGNTNTAEQTIDVLNLNSTTLEISLSNDGEATQTVDLSSLNTMQTLITDTDSDTKIQVEETADEDVIRFDIAGSELMTINNDATVLKGADRNTLTLKTTNNAFDSGLAFQNAGSSYSWSIFRNPVSGDTGHGHLVFAGGVSGNDPSSLPERMRISNTGNVGINTNTPNERLHIVGNIKIVDGHQAADRVLTSDANGVGNWKTNEIETLITDANNDTKIQVEETADEDVIRFDIKGIERLKIRKNAGGLTMFENASNKGNIFFGANAGLNMVAVSNGNNVFIGTGTGKNTIGGQSNVFLGHNTGFNNISGNNNVMLGNNAGYNETGNQKLYIENSASSSPLIYGEFNNDLLRINGTLNINNAFSFPIVDGTANQFLQTDGNGNLTWTGGGILNTAVSNSQANGQDASIDITGSLEVGETMTTYGDVVLAANPGSTTKIGVLGTAISYIINVEVSANVGSISSDGHLDVDFSVLGAQTNSSVIISPSVDLPNQVFIGQVKVSSPNTVRVRFHNESNSSKDPVDMDYYITVIK